MYLVSLPLTKMSRLPPRKPVRIPVVPAFPRSTNQAGPRRPAAPGAVRRVSWRRARRKGVVPPGLLCAAAMVLSTLGCESTTPEDTALVTDGTSFQFDTTRVSGHLWYGGQVPYSFTNRTGSRVYLSNCEGDPLAQLAMERAGEWVGIWPPDFAPCAPPIVIEPDEVYQTTLHFAGCATCYRLSTPVPTASTRYRIRWYGVRSSDGEEIPLGELVSNSFRLEVAR